MKKWPCYFFQSDTTGEKDSEEFYTDQEEIRMNTFEGIGIIKNPLCFDNERLETFTHGVNRLREQSNWTKEQIIRMFVSCLPGFKHIEKNKYLDQKM